MSDAAARATGANRSSMLQDAMRGSPSASAAINGALVRAGERVGVPTPLNHLNASCGARCVGRRARVRLKCMPIDLERGFL